MKSTNNVILITGGTSGIGRALAESFYRSGNQVIIAGRRQALLDDITALHPGMVGRQVDMQDAVAVGAFALAVGQEFPQLNVLVNNAGISKSENFLGDGTDFSVAQSIVQTNILSVLQLTSALLPAFQQQASATIVTTSSGLAFVPRAAYPAYCASKAFLHSWLQSLRFQLRQTAVEVLELAPPYVQTELGGPSQMLDPHAMPLADYIAEVMQILAEPTSMNGEILVKRVEALRWAERNGNYDKVFTSLNML